MAAEATEFRAIVEKALEFIRDGSVVGLGTGHAASAFIQMLGQRVKEGLSVRGVPTSRASARLAASLGIPLTNRDEVDAIDVDVDGADEVDPLNNLIKGYGGALVREKIVAAAARQLVILVGPEKLVSQLGSRGTLPVEVVPFALAACRRKLGQMGLPALPRMDGEKLFVSDNDNYVLDCRVHALDRPAELEQSIRAIPGVVDHGLFLGMKPTVLVQDGAKAQIRS